VLDNRRNFVRSSLSCLHDNWYDFSHTFRRGAFRLDCWKRLPCRRELDSESQSVVLPYRQSSTAAYHRPYPLGLPLAPWGSQYRAPVCMGATFAHLICAWFCSTSQQEHGCSMHGSGNSRSTATTRRVKELLPERIALSTAFSTQMLAEL